MDQTEKVSPHREQMPAQNYSEPQNRSQNLCNYQQNSSVVLSVSEKRGSQNASQNGSRSFSQSGSQMDQQILGGLSKKQKRRYTTFLEALGIDVQDRLSKTKEQPIYDASNPQNQQNQSKKISQEANHRAQSQSSVYLNNFEQPQEDPFLDGGNHTLVETKLEFSQFQQKNSQKSVKIQNIENQQSFILNSNKFENTPNFSESLNQSFLQAPQNVLNGETSKIIVSNDNTEEGQISFDISNCINEGLMNSISPNNVFTSPKHSPKLNEQKVQFEVTFQPQENQLHIFSNYPSQDGQMSMQNNYDPFSNSKPLSEINYDVINSIYTPVSHFKVPTKNPDTMYLDENTNVFSEQQQLTTVIEEFKQLVEEEKDVEIDRLNTVEQQRDVEIDQPERRVSEQKDVQIDGPSEPYQSYQEKDVQIDGPSPIYQNFYQNNNDQGQIFQQTKQKFQTEYKDVEIDGPSHPNRFPQENDSEIDRQSSIYPFSEGNMPLQNRNFSQDFMDKCNPPMEIEVQQKNYLPAVQETSNEHKIYEKEDATLLPHEFQQNFSSIINTPGNNLFKSQSQSNEKIQVFSKPKKNSLSMAFQNKDLNRTAQGNANRRKFSESSRSAGLNSVNNKVTSNKRSNDHFEDNQSSILLSQNFYDSKQYSCFQASNDKISSIEQQNEPHESIKMTPNSNSFSNRSQKSVQSRRSNRFSDEVNQKQVPPLQSLQLISDGKQPRLERRSRSSDNNSNRSNGSRSASTCKKSYDDLSQIHMQKIDEKIGEQLEEKSIKRSIHHHLSFPILTAEEAQNQKQELNQEFFEAIQQDIEIKYTQEDVQIDAEPKKVCQNQNYFEHRNDSVETNYFRHQEERRSTERKENFAQSISHQITIHLDQQQQQQHSKIEFETKSVQYDIFSETSSKKTTSSQKLRQKDEYIESQRKKKMNNLRLVAAFQIQIDQPLTNDERFQNVLAICKKYLVSPNFQRCNFKQILEKNFEKSFDLFGPLKPISDLGETILHDGIFSCCFISFVKLARNSAMMQSLMFTQFEEEVGIWTNRQFFFTELKRVKQERQMHYNNEFEKRLKEYEERKAKEEVRKMQMSTNVIQETVKQQNSTSQSIISSRNKKQQDEQKKENIPISDRNNHISRVWTSEVIIEESNTSVAGSSETMTVDGNRDLSISPIRKSVISELGPKENQSILQEGQEFSNQFSLEQANFSSLNLIKEQKKVSTKKVNQLKKRITKKREKNNEESSVVKTEHFEDNVDLTISQILKTSQNKQKQESPKANAEGKIGSFKEKPKNTKGILKGSRILKSKDEPSSKQKNQKRSPSKKELQKLSKKKKPQISKEEPQKKSNSKSPTQKRIIRNLDTDVEDSNKSETRSPGYKISIQKAVDEKMNQGKVVKFTNSTKGGEKNSNTQGRKNPKIFETLSDQTSQDQVPGKRVLRSRSKK